MPSSWSGMLNISILTKLIYKCNTISMKIPRAFFLFCRNLQADYKVYLEIQRTQNRQTLEKNSTAEEIPLIVFCTKFKATVIKTVEQNVEIEKYINGNKQSLEIKPNIYGQPDFDKIQRQFSGEKCFQHMVLEQLNIHIKIFFIYTLPWNCRWIQLKTVKPN